MKSFKLKIKFNTPAFSEPLNRGPELVGVLRKLADQIEKFSLTPDATSELWHLNDSASWPCGWAKLYEE